VSQPLNIVGPDKDAFSVSSPTLSLAHQGDTQTVTVTFTSPKGGAAGDRTATLLVGTETASVAHSVLYAYVK
jgi:hypothetical protein